ncbi:MAG TPA: hypothetical protein VFO11_14345, partial [Candidatus Polarisedimenticolaceae bacterium]|nr:hypothetical protein [Candidatus Polarisedimenticolaceae bacterium]
VMRPPKFFRIKVQDGDPELAANVARRLAKRIVNENTNIRLKEAEDALETARKFKADLQEQLNAREKQIADYRSGKLWQMPEQLGPNMQLLNATTMRIQAIDSEIAGIRNQIGIARMNPAQVPVPPTGAPVLDPIAAGYAQLKRELADLQLRGYTDAHPDVRAKRSQIENYAKANPQVLAPPAPSTPGAPVPQGASPTDIQIASWEAQIKKLERDKANLEAQLGEYQARINSTPSRQQEMDDLSRGLTPLRLQFDNWVAKETDAERFLQLEKAKQGEQFQISVPAYKPTVPYSPVPWQVILTGLGIGLALGIGISLLFEFLDNSVRTEEEFLTAFPDLPLLASIPDLDRAARSRRRKSSGRRRAAAA